MNSKVHSISIVSPLLIALLLFIIICMSYMHQLLQKENHLVEATIFTAFPLFSTQTGGDDDEDNKVQVIKLTKTSVHDLIDPIMAYLNGEYFVG